MYKIYGKLWGPGSEFFFPTTFFSFAHAHMIILRDLMNIHAALFLWMASKHSTRSLPRVLYSMHGCTAYMRTCIQLYVNVINRDRYGKYQARREN